MMPRPLARRAAAVALIAFSLLAAGLRAAATERPNIILIFADDLGYADLGCYGAKDIATPHLDRLAREGTRFTSFYVAQAVCTASRAALMTGSYPNRLGMSGALNHTSTTGLSTKERTLAEQLKEKGYATAVFGKWHLGHQPPFLPTRRGFDEWLGIPYSNDNGPLHPVTKGIPALPLYDGEEVVEADPDQSRFTERFTRRAVEFIERHRERPFFLYLPHVMPHVPIFASEKFRGASQRGLYGDVVQELDAGVGELLAALRRLNLEEKTLVIFTSDNGPFLSYGEHAGLATPLREGKLTTFEGGMRTPFLARWPGRVPAGRVSDEPLSTLDLNVTLGVLAGATPPAMKRDGTDVSALLLDRPGARGREEFWFYSGDELHAVRLGDWKLHVPHDYLTVAAEPGRAGKPSNWANMKPDSIENSGIRGIASRHGYRVERIGLSLYNVRSDPGETRDVAAAHPDIVARLQARVAAARADLGDSLTGTKGTNLRPAGDFRQPLPAGVRRVANQTYHTPPTGHVLLDLYLPEKAPATPLPLVVWVHGGGWSKGSKENPPLAWLAAEGYAVASINYRLSWLARWPAQIDDVRAALRWLRVHAAKHGLDPDRIAVAGGSAGAHLAAFAGTQPPPAGEAVSSRVRAVIDLYGPSDLPSMPANRPDRPGEDIARTNGARLLGGPVPDRLELAREASPLRHVSAGDPPFLILHGDRDPLVPLNQSERLHAALRAAGVSSELVVLPGAGHGGKEFSTPEIRAKIRAFLASALR
ncbi:MAG: sulfatase-like hydrolase/transferase [Opitutaceae bacterium]|jgi:arylsulfatase A-like enzyme/acetyl esterase/lipase|nr:sulfatase-like hydrolase/transferase [Opitutaceae bacterium]